jgi:hypothetical protein
MKGHSHSPVPRALLALFALILLAAACTRTEDNAVAHREPSTSTTGRNALRDGLYPVLCEAATPESAGLVAPRQLVLPYDRKYSGLAQEEPRTYLAIDTSLLVPLILDGQPEVRHDGTGRALLSVTLARECVNLLEQFTAEHLGKPVAIVLDGEIVTMHTVRSIIREGKLQISRCDSSSCEVLRGKLAE